MEKIISNSAGLARDNGKTVFIPFTIPGETVTAEIRDTGKGYYSGELKDIIIPSPYRVKPECLLFMQCGGCTLQHIDYNYQLEIRKSLIKEAAARNGKIDCGEITALGSTPYSYRNRVQFHPDVYSRPGFMKRNENKVIPVSHCPVCVKGINDYLSDKNNRISERTTVFSPSGDRYYSDAGDIETIQAVLNSKTYYTDISCFFQSYIPVFEKVLDQISLCCPPGGTVIDLYSGTGIIGATVSDKADCLVSVEHGRKAVYYSKKNIQPRKGLTLDFFAQKAEVFVSGRKAAALFPHTLIADPPRSGLPASVRNYIIMKKIKNILYLSCDYNTLGRDLGIFVRAGYSIKDIFFYDFYPQTEHAETLAVLQFYD